MRTILLTLAYDGSGYCGWQVQPNGLSLQEAVELALREYAGESIRVTAAGRTDAGVHALGQLVSFHTAGNIPPVGFRLGLQTRLPQEIVIQDAVEVPYGFSARYDTQRKTYRYVIQNSPLRTPWLSRYVGWHRAPLDLPAMQAALDEIVGTHDFRSFESEWPNKATSVRTLYSATISSSPTWEVWNPISVNTDESAKQVAPAPFVYIDLTADGFLYNMVRAIVGTLIHVGRGNWTAEDVRRIVAAQDRSQAGETAPPEGLYLLRCEYAVDPDRIARRLAGGSDADESAALSTSPRKWGNSL